MADQRDLQFGKLALKKGWITPDTLSLCLKITQQRKEQGQQSLLIDVLRERFLSDSQIHEMLRETAENVVTQTTSDFAAVEQASLLGRYELLEEVGRGGMGCVYKARDNKLDRIVAIKVLLNTSETGNNRFWREARAIAQLKHPNIVTLHDIAQENGRSFLVMDFIFGKSLAEFVGSSSFSARKIAKIMSKAAQAVHYAHKYGIIHRDLKPGNIMLGSDGEPYIMDFGLAKVHDDKQLSRSGTILGTLHYMSPEQAEGKLRHVDARSDVYSLGTILYALLTGRPPFSAPSMAQMCINILTKDPIRPRELRRSIPPRLEAICLKAIAKNKRNRYQSAEELACDLDNFLSQSQKSPSPSFSRNFYHKIAIGAIALALIPLLYWLGSISETATSTAFQPKNSVVSEKERVDHALAENSMQDSPNLDKPADKAENSMQDSLNLDRPADKIAQKALRYLQHRQYDKALILFTKAAEQGSTQAITNLCAMYYNGVGVAIDYPKALELCQKAVHMGDPRAMRFLGCMYEEGKAIKRDYSKALYWYRQATKGGNAGSFRRLAMMYQKGLGVAKDMEQAKSLFIKSANLGNIKAMNDLGIVYLYGEGIAIDYKRAYLWFQRAASQNYGDAFANIGVMHEYGFDFEQSYAKAIEYYQKGAKLGSARAIKNLGVMHYKGLGVPVDYVKALELFQKAADNGSSEAMKNVGIMYLKGHGVEKNLPQSILWLQKAVAKGDKSSIAILKQLQRLSPN